MRKINKVKALGHFKWVLVFSKVTLTASDDHKELLIREHTRVMRPWQYQFGAATANNRNSFTNKDLTLLAMNMRPGINKSSVWIKFERYLMDIGNLFVFQSQYSFISDLLFFCFVPVAWPWGSKARLADISTQNEATLTSLRCRTFWSKSVGNISCLNTQYKQGGSTASDQSKHK